jgi:large subunit ribosomal protein L6
VSRIGKHPVVVPSGVTVDLRGQALSVKGSKGSLNMTIVDEVLASIDGGKVSLKPRDSSRRSRALWGTSRTLVQNMVDGVSKGFSLGLEINGVGYRAAVQGKKLTLQLGFSHEVIYDIPEGITITCERPTVITITGIDRQKVGKVAADIRAFRPPEPYKGKGVKYATEVIRRKEGKKK